MSEPWSVEEIFLQIVDLPDEERAQALAELCFDQATRDEVQRLLDWDIKVPGAFLGGKDSAPPPVESGARIGTYHILRRLGEGGMGTVYSARQEFPDREVALKVLRVGRITEDTIRRFRQEIEVLGRLQHIGIARIYDAGVNEVRDAHGVLQEVPFFTMELVRGLPLLQYARERGIGQRGRIELLARVCDAVHYAHQRAVIHRDLKSENVLVTTEESTESTEPGHGGQRVIGQPKVLDFGIARVMDPESNDLTRQTRAGALVGTLSNMSPEQVSGNGELVDVRTDVYALGVMLYELLCGRAPLSLDGLSLAQAVQRIADTNPEPPGDRDKSLRGDVTTIVLKALEKDPERRYQSAMDLATDLRHFLRGEAVVARADSRLYLMRRSLKRHRQAVAVVLVFASVLGAFAFTSQRQARSSEVLAASEAHARRLAEEDFERAVAAVDVLTELGGRGFAGEPTDPSTREELLEAALSFHRGLLAAYPANPVLQTKRGLTFLRVANLEQELGRFEDALIDAESAQAEFAGIGEQNELETAALSVHRTDALTLRGMLTFKLGRAQEAEPILQEAAEAYGVLREQGALSAEQVGHTLLQEASALKYLATCRRATGQNAQSVEAIRAAQSILESALGDNPSQAGRLELMRVLQELWTIRFEGQATPHVEEDLQRATELAAQMEDEFGDDPGYVLSVMGLRSNHSVYLASVNREQEALAELDLVISKGEPMAQKHREISEIRSTLFSAYSNRGSGKTRLGDLNGAEPDLQRAAELLAGLIEEQRSPERLGKLAVLQLNQAALQIHLGRHADAKQTLASCIASAEEALHSTPSAANLISVHEFARVNSALCMLALGEYAEGMEMVASIEYRQDGYLTPANVLAFLNLYSTGVELALNDEALGQEARQLRAEGYAEEAARYVTKARAGGTQVLDDMLLDQDWGALAEFEAFGEALTAPR